MAFKTTKQPTGNKEGGLFDSYIRTVHTLQVGNVRTSILVTLTASARVMFDQPNHPKKLKTYDNPPARYKVPTAWEGLGTTIRLQSDTLPALVN